MNDSTRSRGQKRSLFALINSVPTLIVELVKSELDQLKRELARKAKHAGIGAGLLVGAAVFAFFAAGVLTAAAILGLAVVFPGWLAALIVAGVLLIIVGVLVMVGLLQLGKAKPQPSQTVSNVRRDMKTIKGTAPRREP